ncbi:MAG TPA: pitrilysin family protein [Leptospiraceae bacterium]|jgi:predicted Zn-dependent peptidase|nr:insulinase family protein [Leptospirales bacterium]HMX57494.1 pitrilysin family protein [Leptospiraceae bacterium]HMY46388.1 pitrilysin family protein [Leptospiraceae bacterium]HMZ37357.1 pitrilysin family protein [Leptospiraceae bacterium]HNE22757.1 pitrilysin family protein [Leptospiraceae bacterium]
MSSFRPGSTVSQLPVHRLPGGERLLFMRNNSYITNIQILTNVGSMAEDPQIHGMAHILEHMFFKGSNKFRGGTAISRAANDIGGKLNAYTTYDHTVFYISVLGDEFEQGFEILSDMYRNPLFPPDEFKKELNPILSEMREREDDPESFLMESALRAYLGSSYHPVIGNADTVKAATVENMHRFKSRYYAGNNCMISIVGGIEEERVHKAVAEHFTDLRHGESAVTPSFEYKTGGIELTKPGIQEAHFSLFYPALGPDHPDRYKQDLMNYLLGGNESGLLFERIREELGLSSYGIYSYVMRTPGHAVLGISGGIAPDELHLMEKEVKSCIARICESKLEEHRLHRARASLRTSIASYAETSSGLNGMIGLPALRGDTSHPVEKALSEIEKITLEDVHEMAQKTFSGPQFRAVLTPA